VGGINESNPHPVIFAIFDVLHLDGCSTRDLPYRERRAVLDDLALDSPYWRTPASLRPAYRPGRRSASWNKTRLRRQERLAVTGLRRTSEGRLEAVLVARRLPDRSMRRAGAIELGLRADVLARLEDSLIAVPNRTRRGVTWLPAGVSVLASCRGLPGGPVRDAVLRDVVP
jgi:bifunctional non-homologous end joining protein LigD